MDAITLPLRHHCQAKLCPGPHQVTDIPHLAVEDLKLTFPKHGWSFDIKTGEYIEKGNHPLNLLRRQDRRWSADQGFLRDGVGATG